MPAKKQNTIEELKNMGVDAALSLAATQPWSQVTMLDIARAADCELADLFALFDHKEDILATYGRQVDVELARRMGPQDGEIKDRLFDILMERFEILNENRAAVLSILHAMGREPKQILYSGSFLCRSMGKVLDIAGTSPGGWCGMVRVAGLSAIFGRVLMVWKMDESPDMPKTMAALDKSLSQAGQVARWLNL